MMRRWMRGVATLGTLLVFQAGPSAVSATTGDISTASFVAQDFGFKGPDRLPAGVTTIQIVNEGQDFHHVQLVRLPAGKAATDFSAALKADPSRLPNWIAYIGGPNAVMPGEKATATLDLESGDYLLLCLIPDRKGVPHLALGMVKSVRVEGSARPRAEGPTAAVTITEVDYGFTVSHPIAAGTHTIRVVNNGKLPHEVVVVQLTPGATIKDFAAAMEPGAAGPPPGKPIGGVVGMDEGREGFFTARFEPGNYGLICFFPEPSSGAPHFTRGMMADFTVK